MPTPFQYRSHAASGYTLIELMVVISIVGLLATFAIIGLGSIGPKTRDAKRLHDIKQIQNALNYYYFDHNAYPVGTYDSRFEDQWAEFSAFFVPAYMKSVPIDPKNRGGDGAMCDDCGEYYYQSFTGENYHLATYLAVDGSNTVGSNEYGPYYSVNVGCEQKDFFSCHTD